MTRREAKLVGRQGASRRKPIEFADLRIAMELAGAAVICLLVPQERWGRIATRMARRADAGHAVGTPDDDAVDRALRSAAFELKIQTMGTLFGRWHPTVRIEGGEHLDAAIAAGKGAILWVTHTVFNSNVTKIALSGAGYRVSHLSRPEHGFSKTRFGIRFLNPLRCRAEDPYLDRRIVIEGPLASGAMRQALDLLRNRGILSITVGAWEGTRFAEIPFLHGRLRVGLGAAALAHTTGAALLPVFTTRDEGQRFRVTIDPPLTVDAALPRDSASAIAASAYCDRLEGYVRIAPDQWRAWGKVLKG